MLVYNGLSVPVIPADRSQARQNLGLGAGELCVLFVAFRMGTQGTPHGHQGVGKRRRFDTPCRRARTGGCLPLRSVRFIGPTNELGMLFAAADVFVLPTYYDPFSNACLEALAAGLPVITTPANGFSEIIKEGVHGDCFRR